MTKRKKKLSPAKLAMKKMDRKLRGETDNREAKEFLCSLCDIKFKSNKKLKNHKLEVHGIECIICKANFISEKALETHLIRKHNILPEGVKELICNKCGKGFPTYEELTKHKTIKHKKTKRQYKCPSCQINFPTLKALIEHDIKKCKQEKIDEFAWPKGRKQNQKLDLIKIQDIKDELIVICDLHEFFLDEAINFVKSVILTCHSDGIKKLEIIHGYRHGTILRTYFRSEEFILEILNFGFKIEIFDKSNAGTTQFKLFF